MKNKGFALSLEDTLLEKCSHSPPPLNSFSTKVNSKMNHKYEHQIFIEDPRVKMDKVWVTLWVLQLMKNSHPISMENRVKTLWTFSYTFRRKATLYPLTKNLEKSIGAINVIYVIIMSRTCFRVNLHSIFALMSSNSLFDDVYVRAMGFELTTT